MKQIPCDLSHLFRQFAWRAKSFQILFYMLHFRCTMMSFYWRKYHQNGSYWLLTHASELQKTLRLNFDQTNWSRFRIFPDLESKYDIVKFGITPFVFFSYRIMVFILYWRRLSYNSASSIFFFDQKWTLSKRKQINNFFHLSQTNTNFCIFTVSKFYLLKDFHNFHTRGVKLRVM